MKLALRIFPAASVSLRFWYYTGIKEAEDELYIAVVFSVQIYCDFSGYTHIAIGSARFLGIRLTENFDRPYLAVSCRGFW